MTDDEARGIYRDIFAAYPDYKIWLSEKVDDPNVTLAIWRKMLAGVPVEIGRLVASQLQGGQRKMPAAYDRGQFGALLRSWCLRIVSDRVSEARTGKLIRDGSRDSTATVLRDPLMGKTLRLLNIADDLLASGDIDRDKHADLRRDAWKAFHAVNRPQRVVAS